MLLCRWSVCVVVLLGSVALGADYVVTDTNERQDAQAKLGGFTDTPKQPAPDDAWPFVLAAGWALRRSPARAGPLLAMAVAAGCFGLKPQSALVAAAAGLFWMAADNSTGAARFAWARILAWSGVGLLLAAVALLPFWSAWGGASRFVDAGRSAQADFVLPLADLPSLLGTWALPGDVPRGLPWAGCLVLLLALVGWIRGRRECLVWALAATVVLFLLRIFGLFPLPLAGLPVIGAIQFVKYCFPFYLGLALLAARGVTGPGRGFAVLALACVSLEMLLLLPRAWPERVDAWRPAMAERPGRISGSVQLAPPLVSAALGFRDLRSIDVLTPSATWSTCSARLRPARAWSGCSPIPTRCWLPPEAVETPRTCAGFLRARSWTRQPCRRPCSAW